MPAKSVPPREPSHIALEVLWFLPALQEHGALPLRLLLREGDLEQPGRKARKEISQYREQYAGKLQFDYSYDGKAARAPFSVSAIYHDDKFTYIKSSAQEKPTIYEIKDGKPNLVNFELANGVCVIPKIVNQGHLALGKKKLSFERHGA